MTEHFHKMDCLLEFLDHLVSCLQVLGCNVLNTTANIESYQYPRKLKIFVNNIEKQVPTEQVCSLIAVSRS